jgi:hypothetical protein
MTLHSLKISKIFKTHCYQQHWLNLKKVMAPLMKNEKKKPYCAIDIYKFEKSYGTFKGGGGKNPLSSTTLG